MSYELKQSFRFYQSAYFYKMLMFGIVWFLFVLASGIFHLPNLVAKPTQSHY